MGNEYVQFDRVSLAEPERRLLMTALNEWSGPARPNDRLALALGFDDVKTLHAETQSLRRVLGTDEPLSPRDWGRVLAATEVVFASDVFGAGCDWAATTGMSDADTIVILRSLQRKLAGIYQRP